MPVPENPTLGEKSLLTIAGPTRCLNNQWLCDITTGTGCRIAIPGGQIQGRPEVMPHTNPGDRTARSAGATLHVIPDLLIMSVWLPVAQVRTDTSFPEPTSQHRASTWWGQPGWRTLTVPATHPIASTTAAMVGRRRLTVRRLCPRYGCQAGESVSSGVRTAAVPHEDRVVVEAPIEGRHRPRTLRVEAGVSVVDDLAQASWVTADYRCQSTAGGV
jgi:hypothetical protein